jgi:hypothetical protein
MSLQMPALAYAMRVKEEQERTLYVRRELHVGIRRDWSRGTRILLVKKNAAGDLVIGSATLEKIVELGALGDRERELCLKNNWYGKMVFSALARFLKPVAVSDTPLAGKPPALLHGLALTGDEFSAVENMAGSRIIT